MVAGESAEQGTGNRSLKLPLTGITGSRMFPISWLDDVLKAAYLSATATPAEHSRPRMEKLSEKAKDRNGFDGG
jgi:hypothetical protein